MFRKQKYDPNLWIQIHYLPSVHIDCFQKLKFKRNQKFVICKRKQKNEGEFLDSNPLPPPSLESNVW